MAPRERTLPGVLAPGRGHARLRKPLLGVLEHGQEDALLVVEVVVERALGDARPTHQILDGRRGIPLRPEALPRDRQQPSPRGLGSLFVGGHVRVRRTLDSHTSGT